MKKIYLLTVMFVIALFVTGCGSAALAEGFNEEEVISSAKAVVDLVNSGDYQGVNDIVRSDLKEGLSVDVFNNAVKPLVDEAGSFVEYSQVVAVGDVDKDTKEDYAVAVLNCKYEKKKLTYTISFNKDMEIVGFYIK